MGLIKSAMGIGSAFLLDGIGDTLRVSLTDEPEKKRVQAGFDISCVRPAILCRGRMVISCPTCGRTNIKVAQIAQEVEQRLPAVRSRSKSRSWVVLSTDRARRERRISELPAVSIAPCSLSRGSRSAPCAGILWDNCWRRSKSSECRICQKTVARSLDTKEIILEKGNAVWSRWSQNSGRN